MIPKQDSRSFRKVWHYLRAGQVDQAKTIAVEEKLPILAASLGGGDLCSEKKGNPYRQIWLNACYSLSKQVKRISL
jgi:hypothetical protein